MEVVSDDSPLATYLEGQGEAAQENIDSRTERLEHTAPNNFAPRGPPRSLRDRLQSKLPAPLIFARPTQLPTWREFSHACKRLASSGLSKPEDERFLEHFRYLIIASHLLVEASATAFHYTHAISPNSNSIQTVSRASAAKFSVLGAGIAATCSFVVALTFHLVRSHHASAITVLWIAISMVLLISPMIVTCMYIYVQRKTSERLRLDATSALSTLLDGVQNVDRLAGGSLKLMQEVEVVARGYEISQPLPPISRLEEKTTDRKCDKLRTKLRENLLVLVNALAHAHATLSDVVDEHDLVQYHGIYDIAVEDYTEAIDLLNCNIHSPSKSLNELRSLFRACKLAWRMLLCDLLALPAVGHERVPDQWNCILKIIQNLLEQLSSTCCDLSQDLHDEEGRQWTDVVHGRQLAKGGDVSLAQPQTPGRLQAQSQVRRLDAMSNGIRSLNAKMHVLRDELEATMDSYEDTYSLSTLLSKQYEIIGSDLRGLIQEWEQGRNTMLLAADRIDRFSRSSSGLRSPMSPSPSLGGLTAVDEGPAEALRVLNGEEVGRKLSDLVTSDEEIFEAVSLPQRRTEMSRGEKMAKMQEDRLKRATLQETRDSSTSMLRELEDSHQTPAERQDNFENYDCVTLPARYIWAFFWGHLDDEMICCKMHSMYTIMTAALDMGSCFFRHCNRLMSTMMIIMFSILIVSTTGCEMPI